MSGDTGLIPRECASPGVSWLGRTIGFAIGAGVCLAIGCYALLGLAQGVSVCDGPRADANLRFWGPIAGFFLLLGGYLAYRMFRAIGHQIQREVEISDDRE